MTRFLPWIGLALLSVSWLPALGYYHPADLGAACILALAGTALLVPARARLPRPAVSAVALGLALPALVVLPWPHRLGVLLMAVGWAAAVPARRWTWLERPGGAALLGGWILVVQGVAMAGYTAWTARSHELPPPLPSILGAAARLAGGEVGVHETTLALFSMRKQHLLGATWELLLDPATFGFLIGGAAMLGFFAWARMQRDCGASPRELAAAPASAGPGRKGNRGGPAGAVGNLFAATTWPLLRGIGLLGLLVALWLPVRATLLIGLYLNQVLRTPYEAPLDAMWIFFSTVLHGVLLGLPVLLAGRFVVLPETASGSGPARPEPPWRKAVAAIGAAAGVGLLTVGVFWEPVGARQAGRIVMEEYHPDPEEVWERTDRPYDTEWYGHLSGYNYYCMLDYLSRYYDTSRLTEPISDRALERCDVLIVKVPTRPYAPDEIRSIERFVRAGGGLLLIGEHTNVFDSGTYLNAIADRFGFAFRHDCLFGIDSVFEQRYVPPRVPHPVVQHMPPLDFATSCSIEPHAGGRTVILDTGLKSALADYHVNNYYPQPLDDAEARYGAFVQLWATEEGRGRVLAFTDSTIFSNFSAFEPGKPELLLGMVEWLNRRSRLAGLRPWLFAAAVFFLLAALAAARGWADAWVFAVAAGLLGWAGAATGLSAYHRAAMPPPEPIRPMVRVVFDRTACEAPLPRNGFIAGKADGFGIAERWVLRLGYFTARRDGPATFQDADLVVFTYPTRPVTDAFRRDLIDYVRTGGRVLLFDDPANPASTAGQLLEPFGLSLGPQAIAGDELSNTRGWPNVTVSEAFAVHGGEAFAHLGGRPVAAEVRYGEGRVAAVGFGSRFTDVQMGVTGDVVPSTELREVFDLYFGLVRAMVEEADSRSVDGGDLSAAAGR